MKAIALTLTLTFALHQALLFAVAAAQGRRHSHDKIRVSQTRTIRERTLARGQENQVRPEGEPSERQAP
jgi:hypothetical protein